MANRIIKDSICESSGLSECSFFADDLYKRLITYADDYGRFNADPQIMLARLYPREMDCTTQEDLVTALIELCGVGKVAFYTCNPRKTVYGCLPRWSEHQRIRDSKSKCPDPDDTDVNDWYLQRFIPIDLRVEIIERDGFKCQICGKFITSDRDAKRLAKHGNGMYHIDHIVPVCHGGRATLENLRLTCPTCNLKKGSRISIKDILAGNEHSPQVAASCGELRQSAASCGELRQSAASCGELRQSAAFTRAHAKEKAPPSLPPFSPSSFPPDPLSITPYNPPSQPPQKETPNNARTRVRPPTLEEVEAYCKERNSSVDPRQFWEYFEAGGWKDSKGNPVRNWKQKLITWEKFDNSKPAKHEKTFADMYREMTENDEG